MVLNRGGKNILVSISKLGSRNFFGLDLGLGLEKLLISISALVSKKFYGLGLETCGLDYITASYHKLEVLQPWKEFRRPNNLV